MKYNDLYTIPHYAFKSVDIQSLCGKEATPYLHKLSDPHDRDDKI